MEMNPGMVLAELQKFRTVSHKIIQDHCLFIKSNFTWLDSVVDNARNVLNNLTDENVEKESNAPVEMEMKQNRLNTSDKENSTPNKRAPRKPRKKKSTKLDDSRAKRNSRSKRACIKNRDVQVTCLPKEDSDNDSVIVIDEIRDGLSIGGKEIRRVLPAHTEKKTFALKKCTVKLDRLPFDVKSLSLSSVKLDKLGRVKFPVSCSSNSGSKNMGTPTTNENAEREADMLTLIKNAEKMAGHLLEQKRLTPVAASGLNSAKNSKVRGKNEAAIKKQMLLKQKAEEQKRKRELKMENATKARQLLLQQEKVKNLRNRDQLKHNTQADKDKNIPKRKAVEELTDKLLNGKQNLKKPKKINIFQDENKPIHYAEKSGTSQNIAFVKQMGENAITHCKTPPKSKQTGNKYSAASNKSLNSTYVAKKKEVASSSPNEVQSYVMTPAPSESSFTNYDISELRSSDDSEEENEPTKPIPAWAIGIRLREAIFKQSYDPPDVDTLFGTIDLAPDEMFGMKRKKKIKRTSSAVWWHTPDRHVI